MYTARRSFSPLGLPREILRYPLGSLRESRTGTVRESSFDSDAAETGLEVAASMASMRLQRLP